MNMKIPSRTASKSPVLWSDISHGSRTAELTIHKRQPLEQDEDETLLQPRQHQRQQEKRKNTKWPEAMKKQQDKVETAKPKTAR